MPQKEHCKYLFPMNRHKDESEGCSDPVDVIVPVKNKIHKRTDKQNVVHVFFSFFNGYKSTVFKKILTFYCRVVHHEPPRFIMEKLYLKYFQNGGTSDYSESKYQLSYFKYTDTDYTT